MHCFVDHFPQPLSLTSTAGLPLWAAGHKMTYLYYAWLFCESLVIGVIILKRLVEEKLNE